MQLYPQPPAQDMTPQRPWWLIYGLSFGAGLGLIYILLFYTLIALPGHGEIGGFRKMAGPLVPQPPYQPSALDILQQRFARGEIDAATYQQMREQLKL